MLSGLRAPLTLTLVVLLGHGPLAWGHTHAGLDAQQLEEHLRIHHADATDSHVPTDWHSHLIWIHSSCPALNPAGSAVHPSSPSADECVAWLCHQNEAAASFCEPSVGGASLRPSRRECSSMLADAMRKHNSYKRLGVLLI